MHLMHGETFEQIEVPREAFGELAVWLRDGMSVRVANRQGPTPLPPIRRSTLPSRPCLSIPASPRPQHAIAPSQHGLAARVRCACRRAAALHAAAPRGIRGCRDAARQQRGQDRRVEAGGEPSPAGNGLPQARRCGNLTARHPLRQVLSNGEALRVPHFVAVGDRILVNTEDGTYYGKAGPGEG